MDAHRRTWINALGGLSVMSLYTPANGTAVSSEFPRRVVDALGRTVTISAAPQRIVAVFPSNIEIVFALGLADRVAAVGGRVRWPETALAKPSVGGSLGYSPEAVAQYAPDLIIVTTSHYTALELIAPFTKLGVPVLVLAHPDLPSVLRNIELIGRASGTDQEANVLRQSMQRQLDCVAARWRGRSKPTVYFETAVAARGAYQTIGSGHYANDALNCAGGVNVFADLANSVQVSAEAIAVRDPEVIISLQQKPKDVSSVTSRPGWQQLRAVRNGRVVVLERSHKLIPGPRQVEAVEAYARALHPGAFL